MTRSTASRTNENETPPSASATATRRCSPTTTATAPADMEIEILSAWATARARGETVAMMANTGGTVDRLNHRAQQTRIATGELDPTGPRLAVGDRSLYVGDEVVTRRNDRTLHTDKGAIVKNRDHWTIDTIHRDGTVTLTGRSGTVRLPFAYTAEHVELGYAQTGHATQGRTVDTALLLIDGPIDTAGIYTPMTRGRHANHAYVVTGDGQTAADTLAQALGREWIDRPAITQESGSDTEPDYVRLWPSLRQLNKPDRESPHQPGSAPVDVVGDRGRHQRAPQRHLDKGRGIDRWSSWQVGAGLRRWLASHRCQAIQAKRFAALASWRQARTDDLLRRILDCGLVYESHLPERFELPNRPRGQPAV